MIEFLHHLLCIFTGQCWHRGGLSYGWPTRRVDGRDWQKCIECGHIFAVKSRVLEQREGNLVEVTPEEHAKRREKRQLIFEQSQAATIEELAEIFRKRGFKGDLIGRAGHVLAARKAKKKTAE